MTRADNSQHLITAARERANSTRERTTTALQSMVDHGEGITFETVASRAGVSRSWLYNATDLRDRIIKLRGTTRPNAPSAPRSGERASDASLLTRLEVTQQRLRQVTTDNAVLRAQLENALGALRAERQGLSHRPSLPDQSAPLPPTPRG